MSLLNTAARLTVIGVSQSGDGSVSVNNTGSITITGTISADAGGAVNLTASGSISEVGAGLVGTSGTLATSSVDGQSLNGANTVGTFNATNTTSGNLSLLNTAAPLTISGISQSGGGSVTVNNTGSLVTNGAITTGANGSISLSATGGVLTIGAVVTAGGSGTISLTTSGATNDVLLQAAVSSTSGQITVAAAGAITESGSGQFGTTGLLQTGSATGQTLTGANTVGSFNATNTSSGDINLINTAGTLSVVIGTTSVNATGVNENGGGNVVVNNVGNLAVNAPISSVAATGGAISLTASGDITSILTNGTISANGTSGAGGNVAIDSTGGAVTLNASVSATGTASTIGGEITVQASGTVTTTAGATINSSAGDATSSGGEILIHSSGGSVSLDDAVSANGGGATGTGGLITIDSAAGAGSVSVSAVSSTGATSGGLVQINSGNGDISQSGTTVITGLSLKLISAGTVTLPNSNALTNLAADLRSGTGSLTFNNASSLTVTAVGTITVGDGTLGVNLPQVIGVKTVGAPITITVTGTLTLKQPVSSDPPAVAGGTIELKASGDITSIASGTVTSTSTLPTGNDGEILVWSTGGRIDLLGDVNADGGATGGQGGTITLKADAGSNAGSIHVSNVSSLGGTVQMRATGGIAQYGSTAITTQNLRLISTGGDVTLTNAGNNAQVLAAALSGASSLAYRDADSLNLTLIPIAGTLPDSTLGPTDGVQTENGSISITAGGSVSGHATVGGSLNTFTLLVHSDDAGILVVNGNVASATIEGNFSGSLTVNSVVDATGNVIAAGNIGSMLVQGSETGTGVITTTAGGINSLEIDGNLAGLVHATTNLGTLLVGTSTFAGSITTTGQVKVGGDLTTLTVTGDVAGLVGVNGRLSTAAGSATTVDGSVSGTITVSNNAGSVTVHQDVSGTIHVRGTLDNLTIDGSVTVNGMVIGTVDVGVNLNTLTVHGSVAGTVTVGASLLTTQIDHDVSGSILVATLIDQMTVGGSVSGTGTIRATTINQLTINGDVSGTVEATGTDTIGTMIVHGSETSTGVITSAGTIHYLEIDGNLAGQVHAASNLVTLLVGTSSFAGSITTSGQVAVGGDLTTLTVTGDVAGVVTVTGNLSTLTVGLLPVLGSLSGRVTVGNTLTNLAVTGDVSGQVSESGTITLLTIGGSLTATGGTFKTPGTITAANLLSDPAQLPVGGENPLANIVRMTVARSLAGSVMVTGNLTTLSVGSVPATGGVPDVLSGTVEVNGTLTTLKVTGDVSGQVTESGTIDLVTISGSLLATGGSLTPALPGTITAANTNDPNQLPPHDPPWLGNINTMTVRGNLAGHVNVTGDLTTLTVGGNLSGVVLVQNTLRTLNVTGDVSGAVTESGTINSLTIGGSLTTTGIIKAVNVVPALGNLVTLSIGQDFAGTVSVSGNLHSLAIVHGSMTSSSQLTVGSLDAMVIGPDQLSVGQNLAGTITVLGTLQSLRVAGGTPGYIIAGHVGTIAVYGGFGPFVLNVVENGIQRYVEATPPGQPYPIQDPASVALGPQQTGYVNFQFFYESGSLANPQLTIQVTNGVGTTRDHYDLSLLTYSDAAKFNLARLDASGVAGVRNVVVEGDLLTAVTPQAAGFFKLVWPSTTPTLDSTPAGIRLPSENLAGVSIRDYVPNGYIQVRSVQAVAFGSYTANDGRLLTGVSAHPDNASALFATGTIFVPAADIFRVAFADLSTQQVALFLVTDPHGGHFDDESVLFAVQSVVAANVTGTANIVTPSNVARGAATALVTAMPAFDKNGNIKESVIQTIAIRGDGASIQTKQWISKAITSTGSLGDLTLTASPGITDVTAPSIFGSITGAPVIGTIQTTGLRTDPITGLVTNVSADLGRLYVAFTEHGVPYVTTSVVAVKGGGLSGRIISRGNLVSQITSDGGISGVIAVQGNLGTSVGTARLGGLLSNGTTSGEIVVLGNVLGNVTLHGGLKSGRLAIAGSVLSNLSIDGGVDVGSAIVCRGSIGNATAGTTFTLDSLKGILAVEGNVSFSKSPNTKSALFYQTNLETSSANSSALEAIFTNGGQPLLFDLTNPQDLQGLTLILNDLLALRVTNGVLSGTTT
ncbi:MAG: beta strand repeat-containing protein [Limisphaerales bacterium]